VHSVYRFLQRAAPTTPAATVMLDFAVADTAQVDFGQGPLITDRASGELLVKLLNTGGTCDHPVDRNVALAHRLGVQGTPTLIWSDGSRTDGYVDHAVLEARLAQASQPKEARP
jgi:protein-disulfide isomerase